MHLTGNTGEQLSENNIIAMSGGGLDVRLRRQVPVSSRPPRLRLGTRALSTQQHAKSQSNAKFLKENGPADISQGSAFSVVGSGPVEKSAVNDNDMGSSVYNQFSARRAVDSGNNNRPLIHHQRHNLKNRFQLLRTLGEGTYGKVKLASDKTTGEQVAIKYIKKTKIQDENDLVRIRREIQILSSLRHKHIVNIREVFEKKDKIVLVMDYAQGGELYDYLNRMGKLGEWDARRIFRQIVSAIHYCHQNGIVHRDLKLENIILDDQGNVKIADFGLSNYYSHNSTLKTFCGSPLYASPEIVNGKPYHGPEVDVWSLGVILYTLVYGSMPFESNSLVSLKQQISEGDYSQPSRPSDAAGLIRHMLTVTPSRRATMEDALRHWWVNLGHSLMPNDAPYSPDDEPPVMAYTLCVDESAQNGGFPPAVIHQRNQSSISSDSDVELDFRPSRWTTKRKLALDSTGSSLSSSVAGSPAPTPDSGCGVGGLDDDEVEDDAASIASGLLKLPPDVLEILKGCSSKSLAALLNLDKISTGFDPDPPARESRSNSDGAVCGGSGSSSSGVSGSGGVDGAENNVTSSSYPLDVDRRRLSGDVGEKLSPSSSVFDSERKPKRGILKRKGKFSGGDSGCVVHEDMSGAGRAEETPMPKSGHLPRRLPSFRDEAHGIFSSKHRATQLLEASSARHHHHEGCSSAVSHPSWCHSASCSAPLSEDVVRLASPEQDSGAHDLQDIHHDHHHHHYEQQQQQHHHHYEQQQQQQHHHHHHQQQQQQQQQLCHQQQHHNHQPHHHHHNHHQSHLHNGDISQYPQSSSCALDNCHPPQQSMHDPAMQYYSLQTLTGLLSPQQQIQPSQPAPSSSTHCLTSSSSPDAINGNPPPAQPTRASDSPVLLTASLSATVMTTVVTTDTPSVLVTDNTCSPLPPPESQPEGPLSSKEPPKVTRRPKSILKNSKLSQMEEARNRLSISSIGSNSSADILDLSYDSGDSDHFINQGLCCEVADDFSREAVGLSLLPIDVNVSCGPAGRDDALRPLSHEFESLSVSSGEMLNGEAMDVLDSKSSLLYRLTRDAQSLL